MKLDTLNMIIAIFLDGEDFTLNEVSLPRSGKGINLLDVQGIVVINVKKR